MPTGTPFAALGRGNGFPFCPSSYVAPPDGDPVLTDMPLADAMRPWWLIYSIRIQASWSVTYTVSTPSGDEPETVNGSGDVTALVGDYWRVLESSPTTYFASVTVPLEPVDRLCSPTYPAIAATYTDGTSSIVWTPDASPDGNTSWMLGPTDGLWSVEFAPFFEFDLGGNNAIQGSPIPEEILATTPEERTISAFGKSQTWYLWPTMALQVEPISFSIDSFSVTIDEWSF